MTFASRSLLRTTTRWAALVVVAVASMVPGRVGCACAAPVAGSADCRCAAESHSVSSTKPIAARSCCAARSVAPSGHLAGSPICCGAKFDPCACSASCAAPRTVAVVAEQVQGPTDHGFLALLADSTVEPTVRPTGSATDRTAESPSAVGPALRILLCVFRE